MVPLRLIAVTTLEPSMPRTGSMIAFPIAIATLRKNWSLPPMNSNSPASRSRSSTVRASAGATVRSSRLVQPTLRWCISSPIESPRAIRALSGIPPASRRAAPKAGPNVSASQRRRASTSASLPPKRITLPRPSLRVQ